MARYTIIGAGPVGALMGLMLARRGQRVCLIERRADPRTAPPERGRSINLALAARGMLALEHAGVAGRIAPQMIAMPGRMLHDEHAALQFLPYGQNEREVIYAISRERLNRILIEGGGRASGHRAALQHTLHRPGPASRHAAAVRRGRRQRAQRALRGAARRRRRRLRGAWRIGGARPGAGG